MVFCTYTSYKETMRISKEPEVRRQEIINSAIELFLKKGYEKTSITDITKNINVSQGLFYRYFMSKEEVFDIGFKEYLKEGIANYSELLLDPKESLLNKLKKFPTIASQGSKNKTMHEFYNLDRDIQKQVLLKLNELLIPIVAGALQIAMDNNEITIYDPLSTASYLLYGQLGIVLNEKTPDKLKDQLTFALTSKILGIK